MSTEATHPSRAASADWARAPERSNTLALRIMCTIALVCGRRVARWLLYPIAWYFVLFAPAPRRRMRRYLTRALGRPARWRDLHAQVFAFAATTLDRVYLLRGQMDRFEFDVRGVFVLDDALLDGRGAFLVGAHCGSFEALRAVGLHQGGLRIAMVMYPDNARMINAALRAIAPDSPPEIIALGHAGSMLAIRDWLDAGGLAGVLADRALHEPTERGATIAVPFLGRDAPFGDSAFRLAALLRRRVVFMAGIYEGGKRYQIRFAELADFREPPADAAERERRIDAAVRAYAAQLEALCREHPHNWFNFHDFWREDEGE